MSALTEPLLLPLVDDFGLDSAPGEVIGSTTRTGHRRHGVDRENVLTVDHGALRINPLVRPGWGRAALSYGPLLPRPGLAASIVLLNGRNGSENIDPWPSPTHFLKQWVRGTQSDSPAERVLRAPRFPRRDRLVRRWRAARADTRAEVRSDENLAIGWCTGSAGGDPSTGPAVVVRSTGPDNAELCLVERGERRPVAELLELPMRVMTVHLDDRLAVMLSVDDGSGNWPEPTLLGTLPLPSPQPGWFTLQQRTLGQVGWGMDTRVREVRVDRLVHAPTRADLELGTSPDLSCGVPPRGRTLDGRVELVDRFDGDAADLDGRIVGTRRWRHVVGTRTVRLVGDAAEVGDAPDAPEGLLSRLLTPSGRRTVYVVDERTDAGSVSVGITPPGTRRGQGEAGRGGLVLYQDPDNYLIVNDWLDDEYGGASVSAFRRIGGFEDVYDAVWTNVGERIAWGRRHELSVAFDPAGFTAFLDGVAVLDRDFRDVYPRADPIRVNAVGLCANWEFGDDTGSRFDTFTVRRRSPV